MAPSPSPLGFMEGRRRLRPDPTPTPAAETDPPASEESPQDLPGEPRGFAARAQWIRDLGAGRRRPLGSPEGPAQQLPNPRSKSRDSSEERRVVDFLAVTIRSATKWLDWALGDRMGKDFVATAEEALLIAGPAAGAILDRLPETGPLANLEEKAGAMGAGVGILTWAGRVMFNKPGGRAESEELHEAAVRRIRKAKANVADEVRRVAEPERDGDPADAAGQVAEARSRVYGLDDDWGTESVGPV